jgi:hypothetical protein
MPAHTTGEMPDSTDIWARYAALGLRPVTGGDGTDDGDDGADDDGDQGKDGDNAAGSGNGDGKPDDDANDAGASGLRSALDKERDARKAAERARKAAEKRISELEGAGKSELTRVSEERDALKTTAEDYRTRYRTVAARESIRAEAIKLGADPTKVDRIVRMVKADLEYDDDGDDPTNLSKLLTDLKKSDEDLFKAPTGKGDAGAGNRTRPKEDNNAWLRRATGRPG